MHRSSPCVCAATWHRSILGLHVFFSSTNLAQILQYDVSYPMYPREFLPFSPWAVPCLQHMPTCFDILYHVLILVPPWSLVSLKCLQPCDQSVEVPAKMAPSALWKCPRTTQHRAIDQRLSDRLCLQIAIGDNYRTSPLLQSSWATVMPCGPVCKL